VIEENYHGKKHNKNYHASSNDIPNKNYQDIKDGK